MLQSSAILRLPYDRSLPLAGIEYAKKALHYTYNRMHLKPEARLRKSVAGVAVELAFQRWLDEAHVPYDRLGMTPFTEKDRYDLRLGGRRCDLKSFLVGDRAKITALRRDPAGLLHAEALVPEDQLASDALAENDVYLFGFLAGSETRSLSDLKKIARAGQEMYLLYTPKPPSWLNLNDWRSLGRLALKAHSPQFLPAEGGAVGGHSPTLRETLLIEPADWTNIWVYGLEIFIAGWLTKAEFRARGRKLPRGSPVKLYARTQTDNRAAPVRDLRPLDDLVRLVKG